MKIDFLKKQEKYIDERFEFINKEKTENDLYFIEQVLANHFLFSKLADTEEI